MVSFIVNDDGTFSPCSQGGEWFLSKLDREKMAKVISKTWEQDDLVTADALIKYLTE
jgi:hypothetical protein